MKFIKLTSAGIEGKNAGIFFYLNIHKIHTIAAGDKIGSIIRTSTHPDRGYLHVEETPEEILGYILEAME